MAPSNPDHEFSENWPIVKWELRKILWKRIRGKVTNFVRRRYVGPGKAPLNIAVTSHKYLEYFGAMVTLVFEVATVRQP